MMSLRAKLTVHTVKGSQPGSLVRCRKIQNTSSFLITAALRSDPPALALRPRTVDIFSAAHLGTGLPNLQIPGPNDSNCTPTPFRTVPLSLDHGLTSCAVQSRKEKREERERKRKRKKKDTIDKHGKVELENWILTCLSSQKMRVKTKSRGTVAG